MMKRIGAIMLALALMIAAIPGLSAQAAETRATRCNLLLRKKASTSSEKLTTIPGGTEIEVLGTSRGWTKTSYNGHTGYVSSNYLMDLTKSGYYPLKEGDENPFVKTLQEKLVTLGYMTGSADGKYGKSTTEAVKAFQKQNGIKADGLAGGETQRTLFGDLAQGNAGNGTADTATQQSAAAKASNKTLKMGDKGDDVKSLQERLIELGYLSATADGIFGSATEKAVREFQKRSSLSTDGKAGKVTQSLLYSTNALRPDGSVSGGGAQDAPATETANINYATLKRGMTSNDVKKLQERLKELGYFNTNATGYYGSVTAASVELFQRSNGLATDGVAGKATLQKIYASDAARAGSVSGGDTGQTGATKYTTLKYGMKSSAVTTMQQRLRELGFLKANATGYFGSQTKTAVVAFQKKHGLTADGIAGTATLSKLYGTSGASGTGAGKISGPSSSQVKLLHWTQSVKPSMKSGDIMQVYDPATGYGWKLRAYSLGRHCDSEPLTAEDTKNMNMAFGNTATWTPKVVYIKLPNGNWTMATTHNTPHLSGSIKDNNFDGHLCVHFLRDMAEAEKNDPKYGVQNQKVLREGWKQLTGSTVN